MSERTKAMLWQVPAFGVIAYLFFLSIGFMGAGMKASYKTALKAYLHDHGSDFTELVSFVIGILGTSVVQSSSTVTSMAVAMAADDILPMTIAIGIVHGANLGTSVTSSLVAFAAETRPLTGNPLADLRSLLFAKRLPGFHQAVSTAVVHGMFNAVLVTLIVLALEIPFGLIHKAAEAVSGTMSGAVASGGMIVDTLKVITPGAYTKPVSKFLLDTVGLPGWSLVLAGFVLLFVCLKQFSTRMRTVLLAGTDPDDVEEMGRALIGSRPLDTFARGLGLTMLVQSSSATTSLVVPLAGMGFFTVRQIFPFVMGANIGTTVTAMLAATAAFGSAGFEAGMTIALCHLILNTVAVVMVVVVPGLYTSVIGCTEWLADRSENMPAALLLYLAALSIVLPLIVYLLPNIAAWALLSTVLGIMIIGPHFYLRGKLNRAGGVPHEAAPDALG